MKIIYCISSCHKPGGMERILAVKANYLADKLDYEVHIVTTETNNKGVNFLDFSKSIKFHCLDINFIETECYSFFKRFYQRKQKNREAYRKMQELVNIINPDIIVSMFSHDAYYIHKLKHRSKKIIEFHFSRIMTQKQIELAEGQHFKKAWLYLSDYFKNRLIKKYDKFIVLTEQDKVLWSDVIDSDVIPNMLISNNDKRASLKDKTVLSVGRLAKEKNYSDLIKAWSLFGKKYPEWKLEIVGDGDQKTELENLVSELNIQDSVELSSFTNDVEKKYLNSSIFALCSLYEGFGMVLIEAMSYGVPCVSYDTKCGPSSIIKNQEDGLIVPLNNISALAEGIESLIISEDLRYEYGDKAFQNVQRYSTDSIMKQWDILFKNLITEKDENTSC